MPSIADPHALCDSNATTLPLLDVSVVIAVVCILSRRGLFDGGDVEVGYDGYGEYPSVYSRVLPRWLRMPFNTLVNTLYLLCGWYWLHSTNLEEEKQAETKTLRGPLLMPLEDAYLFRVYSWMCAYRGLLQALFMVVQDYRLASLCELSRLLTISWCIMWSLHLLEWLRGSAVRYAVATSLSVAHFVLHIREPHGYERVQVHHGTALALLVVYMQLKYGDIAHSLLSIAVAAVCSLLFAAASRNDLGLAQLSSPVFRVLSGHFWSRVAEVLMIHFVACFMFSISVNKYIEKSLQYEFPDEVGPRETAGPIKSPICV